MGTGKGMGNVGERKEKRVDGARSVQHVKDEVERERSRKERRERREERKNRENGKTGRERERERTSG